MDTPKSREQNKMKVIVDHDGAVDDLISLSLILGSPEYSVEAVTICPGDGYREAAMTSTLKFLAYFGKSNVVVAGGYDEGINKFPDEWRQASINLCNLQVFEGLDISQNPISDKDAADVLVDLLSPKGENEQYIMLMTGPLTNLANALKKCPTIIHNIKRLYIMGGAVNVKGNVDVTTSTEWNLYNHPIAASEVLSSGIPITLVPLDACNYVPITVEFLDGIKEYPLLSQAWELSRVEIETGLYFFWDTLTAACILNPNVIKTSKMKIRVLSDGSTVQSDGYEMDVAYSADPILLHQIILLKYI